ncbi:CARDB [Delftia tsuruhatensis]|uniref:DUF7933 domain-containing protein n=2 Tax=Delftia tsuruhatensis TaxID=180282 RepID=UPI001E7B6B1E|nr:hypothetical protein [Delftia tsuruhatensis]CAB5723596.1 CARDB [Delftia tsuruhatensis]CAC9689287.1 CARDB [Delftia tsuruhatensis]
MQPNPSAHRPSRARTRRALCGAGLALYILAGQVMAAPGVPQAPSVVWSENFENLPSPTNAMAGVDLESYVGTNPAGQQYTADSMYLINSNHCNGIIAAFDLNPNASTMATACQLKIHWNGLQQMSEVLGRLQNAATSRKNHALAMLTVGGSYPANSTAFRTKTNIPQNVNSRFFTASVDVVATFCGAGYQHPLLRFSLVNDGGVSLPLSASAIDACVGGQSFASIPVGDAPSQAAIARTVTSPGALLFSGTSVGFILHNDQTSQNGNDAAIDNARILDVTPQLDKAFAPAGITQLQTSRLTLTITNTTDRLAKNGWSFTDSLPAGLTVAGNAGTTCGAGTVVTAPAGSNSIQVSSGNLVAGATFCEVSVDVKAAAAGSFTNDATNVAATGLNLPVDPAVLTVTPVADMLAVDLQFPPGTPVVGTPITGSYTCRNNGPSSADNASCSVTGLPAGSVSAPSCTQALPIPTLAAGDSVQCTITFTPTTTAALTATLTAGSATPDPDPSNNTRAYPIQPAAPSADMQAVDATVPANLTVGVPATIPYSCRNAGPQAAAMATCTISGLPPGFSSSCTPGTPTASPLGPVSLGNTISCTAIFTPVNASSLTITVTAGSSTADPVPSNNVLTRTTQAQEKKADMQVTSVTLPSSITVGTQVTGSFACKNGGTDPAVAATCTITGLPAGVHPACTPTVPTAAPLANGGEISCTLSFTPTTSTALTATITAGSTTADPDLSNNTRTHLLNVAAAPNVTAVPATGTTALALTTLALLLAAGLALDSRGRRGRP